MLKIISAPKQPKILSRDGGILKATLIIIFGCVTFSVLTEFMFFYLSISEYLKIHWLIAKPMAFGVTCFLIYLIEAKGIEFLKYVFDSLLFGRWRKDYWLFSFSIGVVGMCYLCSYSISIWGIPSLSKKLIEAPVLENTISIDNTLNTNEELIYKMYTADSLLVSENYNNQITSLKNEYKARIGKEKTNVRLYDRKEKRTGKSFQSRITYHKGKIETLNAERDLKIGKVEKEKGNELTKLMKERKTSIIENKANYKLEKDKIENQNQQRSGEYQNELAATKNGLSNGIKISIPLLFLCVFIQRRIYQKSGITENYEFDDYFYRPSVLAKFSNYIRIRWLSSAHNKLDRLVEGVKEVHYQPRVNKVFDRKEMTEYIDLIKLEASQMNLGDVTQKEITAIFSPEFRESKNDVPTSHTAAVKDKKEIIEKVIVKDGKLRKCEHCLKDYTYVQASQKFCTESCRKLAWKKKNGRDPFMKKKN